MAEKRTLTCDIPGCVACCVEESFAAGWPGWGELKGIALNGTENPHLCPEHLRRTAEFIDSMRSA